MIETSQLRAFASFAEDTNLSRAARRLHLSQPAVHAQIRRLSEELGTALYRRSGRGLVLTPEGVLVAAFARDADERTKGLLARLRGELAPQRVVLAAGSGALLYVIAEGLRAFLRRRAVRVDLLTVDAASAIAAVRSGLAHVGVAVCSTPPEDLAVHRLADVEQILVVPKGHALARAHRSRCTLESLTGERLVAPPEGRPHRDMLDAALHARGVRVEIGAVAQGWELTLRLVELGFGVAVVNGCCRLPRGLVSRPLRELPKVSYVAFTRAPCSELATQLVQALGEHGNAWQVRQIRSTQPAAPARPRRP